MKCMSPGKNYHLVLKPFSTWSVCQSYTSQITFWSQGGKWNWTGKGSGCHNPHPGVNLSFTNSGSLEGEASAQNQRWGILAQNDEPEFTEPLRHRK